ncbi:phage terminase small subunit [Halopseudomonas pachastrellae]|nr:phage terminase small subunit [Halopseudomonas pachastrellae]
MKLPDRFSRTPATMVAEEVANAALSALKADEQFDVEILLRTLTLTAEHDMPDQVRAKLHLAIGRAVRLSNDDTNIAALERAKDHLATAIKLHDSCGGKRIWRNRIPVEETRGPAGRYLSVPHAPAGAGCCSRVIPFPHCSASPTGDLRPKHERIHCHRQRHPLQPHE